MTENYDGLDVSFMGYVPPQNIEAEEIVIGTCILFKTCYEDDVRGILVASDFYKESNKLLFKAFEKLHEKSTPIDMITVVQQLRSNGDLDKVGGAVYVSGLTMRINSPEHVRHHAYIVRELSIKRNLISIFRENVSKLYSESSFSEDVISAHTISVNEVSDRLVKENDIEPISSVLKDVKILIESASDVPDGITGVSSGNQRIDSLTGGWQSGTLILLGGRPGMGKTARMMSFAASSARSGKKTGVISLEMEKEELVERLVSGEMKIPVSDVKKGRLTENDWISLSRAFNNINDLPILFNDRGGQDIHSISRVCRNMVKIHGVEVIYIDYLQLIKNHKARSREEEVGSVSRELKSLSKNLGVPIIALSQLGRSSEKSGGAVPELKDLRESGSLEQDADMVIFIYRPSYYFDDYDSFEKAEPGLCNSIRGKCDVTNSYIFNKISLLIIAKFRAGGLQVILESFTAEFTLFDTREESLTNQHNLSLETTEPPPLTQLKPNENFF